MRTLNIYIVFLITSINASALLANPVLNGQWNGTVRYTLKAGTEAIQRADVDTRLILQIEKNGKVSGVSGKKGCVLQGLATPDVAPNIMTLNITLSECTYPIYEGRYKGLVSYFAKQDYSELRLRMFNPKAGDRPVTAELKATLRR